MTEFDPTRSDAIRSLLIETVEQTPRRDHRRHLRIAVIAVLAALGGGLGTAAVAVAVTGGVGLPDALSGPPAATAPAAPTAPATPAPPPPPTAPVPTAHPLVLSGDPVVPHDVLTAPAEVPAWSVELPGVHDYCDEVTTIDVSDGWALVVVGPNDAPEVTTWDCDLTASRFSLALVDTSTGEISWHREWSYQYQGGDSTFAALLGTSGRILVSSDSWSWGPREVLDLATGATLGEIAQPADRERSLLYPVGGDSGDVVTVAFEMDAAGPTGRSIAYRADPLNLGAPLWTRVLGGSNGVGVPVANGGSLFQVSYSPPTGPWLLDVLDVDTGVPMVDAAAGRRYEPHDGFELRFSGYTDLGLPSTVAGIDEDGNEIWSRTLGVGYSAKVVEEPTTLPGQQVDAGSDVVLMGGDGSMELVDGLSGSTRWSVSSTSCPPPSDDDRFELRGDVVLQTLGTSGSHRCAFDLETGADADLSALAWLGRGGVRGVSADYGLSGGLRTGGLWTEYDRAADPTVPGTGTGYDAKSGSVLWTRPIAYDERWMLAGGHLVALSGATLSGLG
jgi:hypothetical protein